MHQQKALDKTPITIGIDDAVAMTRLSRATLNKLIAKGTLRTSKVGRRCLIHYDSLMALLGIGQAP